IERLVDLVSPERHPVAGDVKDVAAGAVLICAIAAAIIGCIIFLPYLLNC
ncbi:MAG: diacylglycerol kinase family protein, partial [Bacteroidaceae bacterium]|nr:diacylglycerol kinase family protein [Bacteroidaceae bacterium]